MITKDNGIRIRRWLANALTNRKAEIFGKDGTPYLMGLVRMIKDELFLDVTRQTIATYLKEDLSKYLDITSRKDKTYIQVEDNDEMKEYSYIMKSAKQIWDDDKNIPADRTKAYNSYLKAKKQKEALEKNIHAERIMEAEVQKPNYLISFEPKSALRKCPECGHEFYDGVEKVKKDIEKVEEE